MVEPRHGIHHISFFDHEIDADVGCAMGNHAHLDVGVGDGGQHLGCDFRSSVQVVAYYTDNCFAVLATDNPKPFELRSDGGQRLSGADGE